MRVRKSGERRLHEKARVTVNILLEMNNVSDDAFTLMAVIMVRLNVVKRVMGINFRLPLSDKPSNKTLGFSDVRDQILDSIDRNSPFKVMKLSRIIVLNKSINSLVDKSLSIRRRTTGGIFIFWGRNRRRAPRGKLAGRTDR